MEGVPYGVRGGKKHGHLGLKETSRLKASTREPTIIYALNTTTNGASPAGLALEFMLTRSTVKYEACEETFSQKVLDIREAG
jgi:hypothetical protein